MTVPMTAKNARIAELEIQIAAIKNQAVPLQAELDALLPNPLAAVLVDVVNRGGRKGRTVRDMRYYSAQASKVAPSEIEALLGHLVNDGSIIKVQTDAPSERGRQRVSYITPEQLVIDQLVIADVSDEAVL